MRIGLVGLGAIARKMHLEVLAQAPGFDLVAVADPVARHPHLPSYPSLAEMRAAHPDLEAVTLCTPPQGRFALACEAIAAGLHVMLEKPPGASVSEVETLAALARARGVTLFASWHSRAAPAVEQARDFLAQTALHSVRIDWREDVRKWHPGQGWIWAPGGLGVFDPGINALSLLTAILPERLHVTAARLEVPANRQAPIAAELTLATTSGVTVAAVFDWRETGGETWNIALETARGPVLISGGGAQISGAGEMRPAALDAEYRALYARFAQLVAAGQSDVDLAPLQLVADAFLLGTRVTTAPFHD